MKAIQIKRPKDIEIIDKSEPNIENPFEVKIQIKRVGICGSDMHILHGTSPVATYPRVFGHEVTGEVLQIGSNVRSLAVGDKVVVEPILTCGQCYACRNGRKNVCEKMRVFGVHWDGGAQQILILPEHIVHKIQNDVEWDDAVLVEPFTIGAQAVWRGNVQKDDLVLIMGAGPIGLCILQMAKLRGATCIITDILDVRMEFAKHWGADYVINVHEQNLDEEILKICGSSGPNVTIDAVCLPETFEQAVALTSAAGRVVTLGFHETPSKLAQFDITRKELTILGSRLQSDKFSEVIDLFNQRKIKTKGFISHTFNFQDISEAIHLIENNPIEVRKVLLNFN